LAQCEDPANTLIALPYELAGRSLTSARTPNGTEKGKINRSANGSWGDAEASREAMRGCLTTACFGPRVADSTLDGRKTNSEVRILSGGY